MKKFFLLLGLLIIVFTGNAQSGATCSTAITLASGNSCLNNTQQTANDMWFSFIADASNIIIKIKTTDAYVDSINIDSVKVYAGSCGGLSLVAQNIRAGDDVPDSILAVYCSNLEIGATYFIKTQRLSGNVTFNICKTLLSINTGCTSVCNLIPNGNFETYNTCPNGFSTTSYFDGACWYNPCVAVPPATSDYFNSCSSNNGSDVPVNVFGNQFAHSGNGYAGVYAYHTNDFADYREYLQIQLSSTLIPGKTYNVQMWVSLADVCGTAIDKMGIYFSSTAVTQNNRSVMPTVPAQVVGNNAGSLTNKGGAGNNIWTQIQQNYIANGTENFITVGNFFSNANSNPASGQGGSNGYQNIAYYFIDDISVTPVNENLTATATPSSYCLGGSSIITATGGTGYTWAPSTGLNTTTGSTVIASPSVTTTYTVTSACLSTQTVLVTVNPLPTVTAAASPSIISVPNTSQLTANPSTGLTYSWAPSGTLNNPSIYNPIASPTTTTTYTVTVTNANSCTGTATVLVTVVPPQCNLTYHYIVPPGGVTTSTLTTFFGGTTINTKNILVQGPITVTNNVTFLRCNLVMSAGTNITLTTGNLTLLGQTHIYSCTSMWDGIIVQSGRKLSTASSTFIEDAIKAVTIQQGATPVSTIDQTIFNKNLIAIDLTSNTSGSSPVTITGSVITSRDIPSAAIYTGNPTTAAVKTDITSATPTYTPTVLIPPYNDRKGCYGINATDVTLLNVGSASTAANLNYFDAIQCGVNLIRTNATIYNNKFQNLLGHTGFSCAGGCPPPLCLWAAGIGVKTEGDCSGTGTHYVTIGGTAANQANLFSNTYQAVFAKQYKTHNIVGNNITNTNTGPFTGGTLNYGNIGISISAPAANNVINISNQTLIKNCATGIYVLNASSTGTASLTINNNGDATNAPGTTCITSDATATAYCTNGIFISDAIKATLVPTVWEIKNNVIDKTYTCIYLLNVKRPDLQQTFWYDVKSNSLTTYYKASGNVNGIKAQGCDAITIASNHTKYSGGSPWLGANMFAHGIYLNNSTNMLVNCNKIDDAARGLVFENNCLSGYPGNGTVFNNTMNRAYDGFVLKTNGIIGQQGDATSINSANVWTGPFTNSQTFTENTANANTSSILFMSSATFPTNNKSAPANQQYSSISGGLMPSTATAATCNPLAPAITTYTGMERSDPTTTIERYSAYLIGIIEDNTLFPVYSDESHWMRNRFVYDELKNKPELNSKTALQNFYTNTNTNYSKFAEVNDNILSGQYKQANKTNSSLVPANTIESNQQTINALILQPLLNKAYAYTANDKKAIYAIALQCPASGGNAVFQARNMIMAIENKVIEFEDNCDAKSDRSIETVLDEKNNTITTNFKLYPNPNDGNMTLDYSINKGDKGTVKIYNLEGKLMAEYLLNVNAKQLQVNNNDFDNGIYLYHIIVNDKTIKSDKLVIIKQ